MKVLVTGAAGFVGSHLSEALLDAGHSVVAVDNFATSGPESIERLTRQGPVTFIEADVCTQPDVGGGFGAVAHLACPASPDEYLRLPLETLAVGSRGSEFVLEVAAESRCRVLLASTSEVYGDPLVRPQVEEYWGNVNPVGPRSVYDESKRYAEAMFMAYRRARGVDTAIVRIFNTYGPGLRPHDGRVVSNFIAQALDGKPLSVYGGGTQTRSFCYVSDLVDGLLRMLFSAHSGPINLGNPHEVTVLDLAELVLRITGSASPLEFRPAVEDDPTTRRPDITRADTVLGWRPAVPLAEGIARTVDWQRSLRAAPLT